MTQLVHDKSALELINQSVVTDRVVYAESSPAIDGPLHDESDGEAHTTGEINGRMSEIHEYWGGVPVQFWRVHTVQFLETSEQADLRYGNDP